MAVRITVLYVTYTVLDPPTVWRVLVLATTSRVGKLPG